MVPLNECEAKDAAVAAPAAGQHSRESSSARGVDRDSPQPLILTYHEVWPESSAYLYSVTTAQLEAHLQLIQAIRNSDSSKVRVPRVTFDDGHISTHQHALELLEKYSLPAIFFVTVGFVEARRGVMGWAQLRDVVSQGHEVQSHGWSHAHLTKCTDAELSNELERSKRTLEDRLGVAVEALSFPGGRWNARVLEACARTGYRRVYASQPWLQGKREGVELRGRLMVRRTTEVRHLEELIRGDSAAMLRLRARNTLGATAKFFLGDGGYLRLWRTLARKQREAKEPQRKIRKMNILHLISSGGRYGAENVVLDLTESLQGLGCKPVLGLFHNRHRPNTEIADLARERGVTVEIIPCEGRLDWKAVRAIRRCVQTHRIDLIHTHGYKANFFGWVARRNLGIPVVATIHIWSERNAYLHFYTILDRLILRWFDKAVGVSDEIVNLLRRARIASERIDKVSNGIQVEMFEGAPPILAEEIGKKDRVMVGMVSRLLPEKGVVHYVRAAQQVLAVCPQAFFVLVGDGPEGPKLKALVRELGIENNVVFAGQRSDMPSVYASLDIFVLPSLNEGMPLVILEAMAAKRAVIATRIAGIPEIIQHEKTGLLIEPGDIAPLRDSIVRLISDRELRDRLAADGYARVRQFHSREAMSRSYLRLYQGLLRVPAPAEDVQPQERSSLQPNETGQGSR